MATRNPCSAVWGHLATAGSAGVTPNTEDGACCRMRIMASLPRFQSARDGRGRPAASGPRVGTLVQDGCSEVLAKKGPHGRTVCRGVLGDRSNGDFGRFNADAGGTQGRRRRIEPLLHTMIDDHRARVPATLGVFWLWGLPGGSNGAQKWAVLISGSSAPRAEIRRAGQLGQIGVNFRCRPAAE